MQATVDSLTADNTRLAGDLDDADRVIGSLTSQNAELKLQVEGLAADKTALESQIESLTSENATLETRVRTLTDENTALA